MYWTNEFDEKLILFFGNLYVYTAIRTSKLYLHCMLCRFIL